MEEGTSAHCPACGQSCPWGHQPRTAGKSGPWLSLSTPLQSWVPSAWWLWQQSSRSQGGEARAYVGDTGLVHYNASSLVKKCKWLISLHLLTDCTGSSNWLLPAPTCHCWGGSAHFVQKAHHPSDRYIHIYTHTYTHQPALLVKPPLGKMIIHCPLVDQMQRANTLSKQIRVAFYFRNSLRDLLF